MILTIEQIYEHYEHIARITLVSDNTNEFWTSNSSLYRSVNNEDFILVSHCYDIVDEEHKDEMYIFTPDTCFEVLWRSYTREIEQSHCAVNIYERLRDEALALQAKLEKDESNAS